MELKLKEQVAVVTGAGSGIGKAIAKAMAKEGAAVIINYPGASSEKEAATVYEEIVKGGGRAMLHKADVSKEEEVVSMFDAVVKEYGTVDILVNNVGIQDDSPFEKMTLEQWNHVMNINLTGQFLCAREAVKEFLKRGVTSQSRAAGKIICISSVHEIIPWAGHVNYAASKGGVKPFMRSIAQELASKKIRVNGIAPGAVKTSINRDEWSDPEKEKELLKLIPYGRVGETKDIGKAAVWLASDESDYITGISLVVDGGMSLYPGFNGNG